jgi:sugar lactone lactonase YvrE
VKPPRADLALRVPAQLGEGPCWHAARGTLWWIDITGRRLFEWDLAAEAPRTLSVAQLPGSIAPASDGRFIAALHHGFHLVSPENGSIERYAAAPGHDPQQFRFNDGKVDPQGRFWAGTLSLTGVKEESRLYRCTRDRQVVVALEQVTISNGLAWSPDGRTLYYVDSPTRRVQAFDFDGGRGEIHGARTAFTLGADDGWPDGCCMDAAGCLWLAHWGAGKVTRWDPAAGRRLLTVRLPVTNVTSCAFAGPRLDRLFITTAAPDAPGAAPEPEAGFLFTFDPGVAGLPVPVFAL